MKVRPILLLLIMTVLSFSLDSAADVPPDPGYKRVTQNLVIECSEEMPGYRFFLRSGSDLKELRLKKGERQTVEPLGGGAWYRVGTLIAVPLTSLKSLKEIPVEGSKLDEMQKAVYEGKVAGAVELLTHSFIREVKISESRDVGEAIYRLESVAGKGIIAIQASGGKEEREAGTDPGFNIYSNESKSPLFWATVLGASLLTFALIAAGVWYVRRSRTL